MPSFTYHNVSTANALTLVESESFNSNSAAQSIKGPPKNIVICNTHATADAFISLYLVSQVSTDITTTGILSNEPDNTATTSSVTLTVDGNNATQENLLNRKIYKSDGTLFGTCTAVNSTTEIVFGNGIEQTLANNDTLFTGTRYNILKTFSLPSGSTLVLEGHEISYDTTSFDLVFRLRGVSSGQTLDIKVIR
jgi:hypothetical protein